MKLINLKNALILTALAGNTLSGSYAAGFDNQLILGSEFETRDHSVSDYKPSLSKFDNSKDGDNPYIGKLHRTFESGFSPERDHSLFVKRIREGVELYKERGATKYSNKYNMFRAIAQYLPGGSMGYDGGQPVIAMFTSTRQVFLIYRVYEAKDGRSTLMCYYNSDGKIGHGGRGFAERKFTLKGYKLRKGFRFTQGGSSGKAVDFSLIDPAEMYYSEGDNGTELAGRLKNSVSSVENIDAKMDLDWEKNPPHPDNASYGSNQVAKKAEGKTDIFQSILDPLMFGAKIGVGAYMLKEAFKKDDDDDDDDEFQGDYGYGMDYGMGHGMEYGMGSIMGPGNMQGMYPGMMPGMYPGMQMPYPGMQYPMQPPMMPPPMTPPYQQPGYPGAYPGTMPGGNYPGAQPMPVDYSQPYPGDYPGAQPIGQYPGGQYNPIGTQPTPPPGGGYNPTPIGPYTPPGADPNMYPVPGNTAPLAPTSSGSTSNYNLGNQIYHNENTYLSTMGQ